MKGCHCVVYINASVSDYYCLNVEPSLEEERKETERDREREKERETETERERDRER